MPHAPEIYLDRATLWNAVENCEKHPKAQLAYSFDIAIDGNGIFLILCIVAIVVGAYLLLKNTTKK